MHAMLVRVYSFLSLGAPSYPCFGKCARGNPCKDRAAEPPRQRRSPRRSDSSWLTCTSDGAGHPGNGVGWTSLLGPSAGLLGLDTRSNQRPAFSTAIKSPTSSTNVEVHGQ